MLLTVNRFRALLLLSMLVHLGGCGAGVITGGILGNGNSGSASAPLPAPLEPTIALQTNEGPLFLLPLPQQVVALGAVLNNIEVPAELDLRVELRALDVVSVQLRPELDLQLGGDLTVSFFMRTKEISDRAEMLFGLTSMDVEAELVVLFNDEMVARPAPFRLLRQPIATLATDPGQPQELRLSASGGTRVRILITSLPGGVDSNLRVDIATPGLPVNEEPTVIVTALTDIVLSENPDGPGTIVEGTAPPSRFPTIAAIRAQDSRAGVSTAIVSVFYVPNILAVVPRRGAVVGGDLVSLSGDGLVPLDLNIPGQPQLGFARVDMIFQKGGRSVVLVQSSYRPQLSSLNNIVFVAPPSPDGRPGPVDITLRVSVTDEIHVVALARNLFTYGVAGLDFGPLGQGLRALPLDIAAANFRLPRQSQRSPLDLVLLGSNSGIPEVAYTLAQSNGTFLPIGQPVTAASVSNLLQRNPIGLAVGDFNQDGNNDLFILNQGDGVSAEHSILLSDKNGGEPSVLASGLLPGRANAVLIRAGDLDENGDEDMAILHGPGADPFVEVLLTQQWNGIPSFATLDPGFAVGDAFEALDITDVDGDGHLDLLVAMGGAAPLLAIAYGLGDGQFTDHQRLDLQATGFTPDQTSRVIGVHGTFPGNPNSIAVLFSGGDDLQVSSPTMMLIPSVGPRMHGSADSVGGDVFTFSPAGAKVSASLAADIDGDQVSELVVGFAATVTQPIRMLQWQGGSLVDISDNVQLGEEVITHTRSLRYGLATSADGPPLTLESAVLVVHESWVDGVSDPRVTTLIVSPGPMLVSPIKRRNFADSLRSMVVIGQSSRSDGEPGDVAAGFDDSVTTFVNDGFGDLAVEATSVVPNLIEETLLSFEVALPTLARDSLAFLTHDGRLGVIYSGTQTPLFSPDLRRSWPLGLENLSVSSRSKILTGDVNRDSMTDLVVLLVPDQPNLSGDDEAAILLFSGEARVTLERLPVQVPDLNLPQQLVHGGATGMVLADFAPAGNNSSQELAVAIPAGSSGDHIRFYRLSQGGGAMGSGDQFVRSFAEAGLQSLPGGFGPRTLLAGDVDLNGHQDLIVATEYGNRLSILLNSGQAIIGREGEVNIRAFNQSASGSLPPGTPIAIHGEDYDGDGIVDYLVQTRSGDVTPRHNLSWFISDGVGRFVYSGMIPLTRFGDLIPEFEGDGTIGVPREAELSVAVMDVNRDGTVDLILGWGHRPDGFGSHLRMLFGGFR